MKKLSLVILLFIGVFVNGIGQIPTDSLSVYYQFNGNTQDESGNELHATLFGANLTADRFENLNSAYNFDGISDHLVVPYSDLLQVDFPYTISVWVKIDSFSDETSVLFTNDESNFYSGFWILYNPNGRVSAGYGDGTGFGAQFRRTKHSNVWLEADSWHHIVASFNALNDIDLYINCEEDPGFYSGTGTSMMNNGQPGVIGRDLGSHPNSYHHGAIDDIRVYRNAITSEEALSLCEEADSTVSISEINGHETGVVIFPNPVSNQVNFELDSRFPVHGSSVRITDLSGRIVDEKNFTNRTLSINPCGWGASGMYFAQIQDEDGNKLQVVKIMLE